MTNRQSDETRGWKGIGRSLVVAVIGPEDLAAAIHAPHVVVVELEGAAFDLARRRALAPDLVDVAVIEATGDDREDKLELSRVLRSRLLASVLVLPRDRWGKRVFRSYLGVYRQQGRVFRPELGVASSVAAQTTWSLGWLRLDRLRAKAALDLSSAARPEPAPPSRTAPWAPPPDLLVELTKAYERPR